MLKSNTDCAQKLALQVVELIKCKPNEPLSTNACPLSSARMSPSTEQSSCCCCFYCSSLKQKIARNPPTFRHNVSIILCFPQLLYSLHSIFKTNSYFFRCQQLATVGKMNVSKRQWTTKKFRLHQLSKRQLFLQKSFMMSKKMTVVAMGKGDFFC